MAEQFKVGLYLKIKSLTEKTSLIRHRQAAKR
jgi:hypothetical protein